MRGETSVARGALAVPRPQSTNGSWSLWGRSRDSSRCPRIPNRENTVARSSRLLRLFVRARRRVATFRNVRFRAQQLTNVNGQNLTSTRRVGPGTAPEAGSGRRLASFAGIDAASAPARTTSVHLAPTPAAPMTGEHPGPAASELVRRQAATPCMTLPDRSRHRSHHVARFTFSRLARAARLPASSFAAIPSPLPK